MPLKPSPYAAEIANSPASLRVTEKAAIAKAWQADPANTVARPPIRSAAQPQNCRLTKAQPSNTDSIAAPCAGAIPTSLQNATRWLDGIAIGTQHRNDAAHSRPCTVFGRSRNAVVPRNAAAPSAAARLGGGGMSIS